MKVASAVILMLEKTSLYLMRWVRSGMSDVVRPVSATQIVSVGEQTLAGTAVQRGKSDDRLECGGSRFKGPKKGVLGSSSRRVGC